MYAQLTFNVVDDIGTFHLPELAAAPYYELLRSYLADAMSDQAFCAALRELHQQEPQCLEVIASLTGGLAATLPSNALAYADKGLALTAGLIPRRFNGTIPWEHPGNKAFYRLLFAAALANICNGTFEKAMHIIKVSLARNPADPLGIRNLIDELPARCVY